ncbi:DNA segregation ATPase, FtsK/SpoIIIE family [Saccharomonospora marina XMU15]|uniref:DNA segregation ATPase, FtsK/SpoIIIE family n=1 Tax=Saccharomonospora marina XMU15 TaxID=882083 RepID=H5X5B0_9PSEU|nr:cell division protein FtsK [Saccharomonospora marina]EHR48921.1 DNA segregation ATPase, FtsK/SpoIIIE family [Saccharomonospora marina XMU15]
MTHNHEQEHVGGNVVPFRPDTRPLPESEEVVVDAELVEEPRETWGTRRLPRPLISEQTRQRMAEGAVQLHHRATPVVVRGGKRVWLHASYLRAGAAEVGRASCDRLMQRDITEAIRQARAKGDLGMVAALEQQRRDSANARWQRIKTMLEVTGKLAKATTLATIGVGAVFVLVTVVMAVYGVAAQVWPGGEDWASAWTHGYWGGVTDTATGVADVVTGVWSLATALAPWVLAAAGITAVRALHKRGKDSDRLPAWAQHATQERTVGEVVEITPSAVVAALRDLGIAALRNAIKDDPDAGAWMLSMITQYGPGSQVDVRLPSQVTAADIMARRDRLAGNLDRAAHEVHIERSPDSEREFTLWVAQSGALDRPLPPSPLADPGFGPVDIYRDTMPWGLTPKGDPVELNLLQQHFLLAGLSKQGKTAAARSLMLWVALDPTTRIWLADLKGFGDWSMFDGLAETLIEGAGDDNFVATCDMLETAVAQMERRYEARRAQGKKGDITRAESQPGSGFEPLFVVIDEVQKLYTCTTTHPDGGDIGGNGKKSRAARAAQALHDQARAVNIHLVQFAQNPTNANLPVVVREGAMIRGSLFVGTESIARMALGEAPVDTGAAPHALRSGLDRGTVVLAPGESMDLPGGATHVTVRTHFISTEQAYTIAQRAKELRAGQQQAAIELQRRDLLADTAHVLGQQPWVKAADIPARLRDLAPTYPPYQHLDGTRLKTLLESEGVKVTARDGYPVVRLDRITAAMAHRNQE